MAEIHEVRFDRGEIILTQKGGEQWGQRYARKIEQDGVVIIENSLPDRDIHAIHDAAATHARIGFVLGDGERPIVVDNVMAIQRSWAGAGLRYEIELADVSMNIRAGER